MSEPARRASLDPRAFAEPPCEFWPGYFWFWNDDLSPDLLRAQLQDMSDRGARSVCPHPLPAAFSSELGHMQPDYLSQDYLERHRHMVEEAARLGMNVWLYDEGGWPSGSACGKVVASDETLAAQVVRREEIKLAAGTEHTIAADALACFTRTPGGARERSCERGPPP